MKNTIPLRPYFPLSVGQALQMRELLPAMVAWLRAREAAPKLIAHPHWPKRVQHTQRRAA